MILMLPIAVVFEVLKNRRIKSKAIKANVEEEALLEGKPRVKFSIEYMGTIPEVLSSQYPELDLQKTCRQISAALWEMEQCGAAPVLPDGKVGGNCALLINPQADEYTENQVDGVPSKPVLLVSRSGKEAGLRQLDAEKDLCLVQTFDEELWAATYFGDSEKTKPTSDSPMHYMAFRARELFGWPEQPRFILHGHALATEEEASALNMPISLEETLFSTPEDTAALLDLMRTYPYPRNKIFIRKGHGFLLLAGSIQEAVCVFKDKIKPNIRPNRLAKPRGSIWY